MGARPERGTGIDHHVGRVVARLFPRRPHEEPVADEQRLVKVAPAVRPVFGNPVGADLDQPVAHRRFEPAQRGELALGPVDRVLDVAGALLLLDPSGASCTSSASTRSASSGLQRTARRIKSAGARST